MRDARYEFFPDQASGAGEGDARTRGRETPGPGGGRRPDPMRGTKFLRSTTAARGWESCWRRFKSADSENCPRPVDAPTEAFDAVVTFGVPLVPERR